MTRPVLAQETVFALRETIARMEGKPIPAQAAADAAMWEHGKETNEHVKTEVALLDAALDGGLPCHAITEIRSLAFSHAGAATGFTLALATLFQKNREKGGAGPFLWISDRMARSEAGAPYPLGLLSFGLDTSSFFQALPQRLEDALWLAEAALASGIFAATILEVRGNPQSFGLTESRRLSLRAKAARRPLLLLRQAGEEEASSAIFRFRAEPALAPERRLPDGSMLGGSIGHPAFRVTLEKSRNPASLCLDLEWNPHDRQFLIPAPTTGHSLFAKAAHSRPVFPAPSDRSDPAAEIGTILALERAS